MSMFFLISGKYFKTYLNVLNNENDYPPDGELISQIKICIILQPTLTKSTRLLEERRKILYQLRDSDELDFKMQTLFRNH